MTPFGTASGALAHPHAAEHAHGDTGQVIANGQNHPAFINGESCETFTHLPGYGPAWYGLETAHHGPDAGDPGRGDGCYQIEGRLSPLDPASDRNPGSNSAWRATGNARAYHTAPIAYGRPGGVDDRVRGLIQ
jgi:hypothetical protein